MLEKTKETLASWRSDLENELVVAIASATEAAAELGAAETRSADTIAQYRDLEKAVNGVERPSAMISGYLYEVRRERDGVRGDLIKARLTVENCRNRIDEVKAALAQLDEIAPATADGPAEAV